MIKIRNTSNRNLDDTLDWFSENIKDYLTRNIKKIDGNIKDFIEPKLTSIITGTPNELEKITRAYDTLKKTDTDIENLRKMFNYDSKIKSAGFGYTLAKKLNVNVCPYCNRQYTFTVNSKNKNIVRPSFDHFIPKNKYPLLALSFYNLIPSCHICNSSLKGNEDVFPSTYIHPYIDEFENDAVFCYDSTNALGLYGLDSKNLKISIHNKANEEKKERIDNNIELFKLIEIYQYHSDWVSEILKKLHLNNGEYLKNMSQVLGSSVTAKELYLIVFSNYLDPSDFDKRPLAKLTRDIVMQADFRFPGFVENQDSVM